MFGETAAVQRARLWPSLIIPLVIGLALKTSLELAGHVTFNADEAILGLMARHILQGEWPVFFYGQSYMGALHAYLIAPFFALLGQTVLVLRLVQMLLYAGVLITTGMLAWRISRDRVATLAAALLIAVPPVLFSTYTSAALGNYVETLLINNLLVLIAIDLFNGRRDGPTWWLLAGLLGGVGWWGMALILVALLPLAFVGMWVFWRHIPWGRAGLLLLGFLVGALPWLTAVATNLNGVLDDLAGARVIALTASSSITGVALLDRLVSLLLFNLTALVGLRPPWSADWIVPPAGILVVVLYLGVLVFSLRRVKADATESAEGTGLKMLLGIWATLLALFLLSRFGIDPTGRYLLPLYPPLAVITGVWLAHVRLQVASLHRNLPGSTVSILLAALVGYNLVGNVQAALADPPGLTTQFDPITHIPHDHDQQLISFLDGIGVERGYSNYWVAYRFAFLTHERILLSPQLPYKLNMSYTYRDDRYPLYTELVGQADRVVYITSNHPQLDAALSERLEQHAVTYQVREIGPYTVFYNLSRPITPREIGPFGAMTQEYPEGNGE